MDNKNKTKFTQWGQLFRCKTLTGNQRVILGIILNFHNLDGWDFTPLSVLTENSGFTKPTVIKNVNVLVKKGLLKKSKNKSRQTNGTAPNDYIPNYDIILNLLKSQVSNFFTLSEQEELKNFTLSEQEELKNFTLSEQEELKNFTLKELKNFTLKELKNFTQEEKKKEKNKASIYYNNNNLSTRRYMVYSDNENENKQNTNDMDIIINETENGNPINALLGFDKADERGWDIPTDVEETATRNNKSNNTEADPTAADTENTQNKAHSEEIIPQVDNYTTAVEKTPQERDLEGNLETETADDETDSPNNGADTADATNTLSKEDTQRIMSQAAQTIMKNRKHAAKTDDDKIYKAFNASINGANTAADAQKAPKNDRGEEIIPQVDNYTTAAKTTPQERYFDNMGADTADTTENGANTADTTENGADTADARPIYNTIHAADEWSIRNAEDTCWQETLEYVTTNLANPSENEIRNILNQVYKDWENHDKAINAKMVKDMKKYVEYKYQMDLNKKEKRDTVNYQAPKSDAYPTVAEIENLDLCHISKNRDILNILSAGCTRLDTVIISLTKASEFVQIYRISTPQLYNCISNAMATINNYPTVSDKKAKYITDLATHLCDMLDKVC